MKQGIRLNLRALKKTAVIDLKGKSGNNVKCLVIPIVENHIYVGGKGLYLDLTALDSDKLYNGKTHVIKQQLPKEIYEAMCDEERMAMPILGDMQPLLPKINNYNDGGYETMESMQESPISDDMPF